MDEIEYETNSTVELPKVVLALISLKIENGLRSRVIGSKDKNAPHKERWAQQLLLIDKMMRRSLIPEQ